eukprot:m51a1_g2129 hypothetical protein (592) ;mRNA; r:1699614-1703569
MRTFWARLRKRHPEHRTLRWGHFYDLDWLGRVGDDLDGSDPTLSHSIAVADQTAVAARSSRTRGDAKAKARPWMRRHHRVQWRQYVAEHSEASWHRTRRADRSSKAAASLGTGTLDDAISPAAGPAQKRATRAPPQRLRDTSAESARTGQSQRSRDGPVCASARTDNGPAFAKLVAKEERARRLQQSEGRRALREHTKQLLQEQRREDAQLCEGIARLLPLLPPKARAKVAAGVEEELGQRQRPNRRVFLLPRRNRWQRPRGQIEMIYRSRQAEERALTHSIRESKREKRTRGDWRVREMRFDAEEAVQMVSDRHYLLGRLRSLRWKLAVTEIKRDKDIARAIEMGTATASRVNTIQQRCEREKSRVMRHRRKLRRALLALHREEDTMTQPSEEERLWRVSQLKQDEQAAKEFSQERRNRDSYLMSECVGGVVTRQATALAMAYHQRLGKSSPVRVVDAAILAHIVRLSQEHPLPKGCVVVRQGTKVLREDGLGYKSSGSTLVVVGSMGGASRELERPPGDPVVKVMKWLDDSRIGLVQNCNKKSNTVLVLWVKDRYFSVVMLEMDGYRWWSELRAYLPRHLGVVNGVDAF